MNKKILKWSLVTLFIACLTGVIIKKGVMYESPSVYAVGTASSNDSVPTQECIDSIYWTVELYEVPDTIIYSTIGKSRKGRALIPIDNLPVRNLSYYEIIRKFGGDAILQKRDITYADSFPLCWSCFPRSVAEKCYSLGCDVLIYLIEISYRDASGDSLVLWVYNENEEVKILWGIRTNPACFNLI